MPVLDLYFYGPTALFAFFSQEPLYLRTFLLLFFFCYVVCFFGHPVKYDDKRGNGQKYYILIVVSILPPHAARHALSLVVSTSVEHLGGGLWKQHCGKILI